MPEATHYRWANIQPEPLNPLITRQYIVGANTMLARIVLKKGARVPMHQHFHEQISHVVEGSVEFLRWWQGSRRARRRNSLDPAGRPARGCRA